MHRCSAERERKRRCASQPLTGLSPDTTYFYRVAASNEQSRKEGVLDQGQCPKDCGHFTTTGPGISGVSVTEVTATSATLDASIDPNGAQTSVSFQYSVEPIEACAAAGTCLETPVQAIGAGSEAVGVEAPVQGLSPDTVYHYRLVVDSAVRPEPFDSEGFSFVTQTPLSGPLLADGRAWELVSPPDKHGGSLLGIGETWVSQAAANGGQISYAASGTTESGAPGYFELVQVLSKRAAGGWSSQDVSLPHSSAVGTAVDGGSEYRFFSSDLSLSLAEQFGPFTSLQPEVFPPDSERTPYLRHDETCATEPGRCYEPLVLGCPSPQEEEAGHPCPQAVRENADVPPGTHFGGPPSAINGDVTFVGATPDLQHVILSSRVALSKQAQATAETSLYEWSAGMPAGQELPLINVLEDGTIAAKASLGSHGETASGARGAVSVDGSRVLWSVSGGHLYLRDMLLGSTMQLDVPQPACVLVKACGEGLVAPKFQEASSDGSVVFFTDTQRLTADAGVQGKPDLYACDMVVSGGRLECLLTDLTPMVGGVSADVQGLVLGAAEDGSRVYFVANGVLAAGNRRDHVQKTGIRGGCCVWVVCGVACWWGLGCAGVGGGVGW